MHGRFPGGLGAVKSADAAKITATPVQLLAAASLCVALAASIMAWPRVGSLLLLFVQVGFLAIVGWRLLTVIVSLRHRAAPIAAVSTAASLVEVGATALDGRPG